MRDQHTALVLVTREVQVIQTNLLLRFSRVPAVSRSRVVVSTTSRLFTLLSDLRLLTAEANLLVVSLELVHRVDSIDLSFRQERKLR